MTDLITDERVSKALQYLIDTDEKCGNAKAYFEGLRDQTKTIEGTLYLQITEKMTVAEKEASVWARPEIKAHLEKVEIANADFEIMRNRRKTAELIIEMWRSVGANKRRGNI